MDFQAKLKTLGIDLTDKMKQQFRDYYIYLIEQNQVMNLTTITEEEDVYLKHFFDSLSMSKVYLFSNQTILDVGAGAGFPSIPLKICFPKLKITILDSLQKRILFLEKLMVLLELEDVRLIHGRAEEFKEKEAFDLVSARAVAKLQILSELCLPFVKKDGYFIAMKSKHYREEVKEALPSIQTLGGIVDSIQSYSIDESLKYVFIKIKKLHKTPDIYPRNFGQIKKHPL
ncbi:MAG: 16S rRNA (guanine(527)-N(7))-methyltransferase RsmG [Firmicutes bacterium]|nr:16S rRNA (guanine(527)-N(7))-methyltransferase RsmG [Bacillota bacterium]